MSKVIKLGDEVGKVMEILKMTPEGMSDVLGIPTTRLKEIRKENTMDTRELCSFEVFCEKSILFRKEFGLKEEDKRILFEVFCLVEILIAIRGKNENWKYMC